MKTNTTTPTPINIRLPRRLKTIIRRVAAGESLSVSAVIRRALAQAFPSSLAPRASREPGASRRRKRHSQKAA